MSSSEVTVTQVLTADEIDFNNLERGFVFWAFGIPSNIMMYVKDTCAIKYPVEWLKIQLIFIFGWNSKGTQNRIGLQKVQNKVNWLLQALLIVRRMSQVDISIIMNSSYFWEGICRTYFLKFG